MHPFAAIGTALLAALTLMAAVMAIWMVIMLAELTLLGDVMVVSMAAVT